jgi:N-acetylglucosamine-6-phosphate deacetylase
VAPGRLLLAGGRIVTPGGVLSPGWIRLAGDLIDAAGPGDTPGPPDVDLHGQWVLPGFVDLHVHGGGGASFTDGPASQARQAAAFHARRGSTTVLASLVTAPAAELAARAARLAGLAAEGVIAGLHAEGPFLSPAQAGAQDPRHMLAPDLAVFGRLHAAAGGWLRILTLAPELPGALTLIETARKAGVSVAVGHTDATAAVTLAAIDAGATHATHLFNAMPPLHHREPGPAGALLDRAEVTCEVIADGVHTSDLAVRLAFRAAGPGRMVLVSDATAAAGMPDGRYRLGPVQVTVAGGVARLARDPSPDPSPGPSPAAGPGRGRGAGPGPGALAGSTVTLADVVRRAIAAGLPVPDVAAAASTVPARILGLQTGALQPGLAADLVICDGDFRPRAVMRRGRWLTPPGW